MSLGTACSGTKHPDGTFKLTSITNLSEKNGDIYVVFYDIFLYLHV